jgi:hypothetical protein
MFAIAIPPENFFLYASLRAITEQLRRQVKRHRRHGGDRSLKKERAISAIARSFVDGRLERLSAISWYRDNRHRADRRRGLSSMSACHRRPLLRVA